MRRRIVILLMVFGLVLGGPAGTLAGEKYPPDLERIQKRGKLVVLAPIAPDAFPCLMEDEAGNPYGLDLDIARDVADKLGVKLEFIRMGASGDEKVEMIARGEADMATCLGITPQRARKILFTKPYITEHYALVVNRVLDARLGGHAYTRLQEGKAAWRSCGVPCMPPWQSNSSRRFTRLSATRPANAGGRFWRAGYMHGSRRSWIRSINFPSIRKTL